MCNHYRADPAWRLRTGEFSQLKIPLFDSERARPNTQEHLYPGRIGEILHIEGEHSVATAAVWRLIPPWFRGSTKDFAKKYGGCNNARSEGIARSPMFKSSIRNRCLIPVASIFEYAKDPGPDGKKIEYEFTPVSGPLWAAGLFQPVEIEEGPLTTYAMVMTNAGPEALSIGHQRSPIFVPPERLADWLDPATDIEGFAISPPAGTFSLAVAVRPPPTI